MKRNNIRTGVIIVCLLGITVCLLLLIPQIRQTIIEMTEQFLMRRELKDHAKWHKVLFRISITGGLFWGLILFCFLFKHIINKIQKAVCKYLTYITNKIQKVVCEYPAYMNNEILKVICKYIVIIISLISVFIIMYKANWIFSDDHEYIVSTAVNKYMPFHIGEGRFMPFRYFQYNLPLFVFRCLGINTGLPVEAHFAVISMFFIVTVFCLYSLFNRIEPIKTTGVYPVFNSFFACAFFLLESSFFPVFSLLIFPETQVIMLFSVFMLMYYKALKTDKIRYYAAALLAAIYSTYCKEPVFGVFLVIAFVNYLFRYNKKSKREKIFYITLAVNGILFMILYYFLSFKNAAGFYNEGRVFIRGFEFLMSIFKGNPVLIIMFGFGLIRLYSVIVRKERDRLFFDSLLFAGIAYVFAIFVLHLNADYYFLPSIILFLPSLVHWIKYLFEKKRVFAAALFIILLPLYINNYGETPDRIKDIWRQRQEFMPYITNLFSEYNDGNKFIWYESDDRITDDTFYIAVRGWRKHIENAFLNYLNKSEGINFFATEKSMERITLSQNILFFYPVDNDQNQPMRDELVKTLRDNNFALYKDSYGVLIYKQH